MNVQPNWLNWARTIQAIAQNGLTFSENHFDHERYQKLNQLSVEILATHTGLPPAEAETRFKLQPGYATPKVDVRGACFRDGKILLVKEKSDGRWCLPGGWADVGDVPSESAAREVSEESGFECKPRKIIGVFDANHHKPLFAMHAYKLIFWCDITGGDVNPDHEIADVNFFSRESVPELSNARTSLDQIQECFAHLDDPNRRTAFD
ncbi:MAG: NUDIX hydrolase [Chloroflexi bacterium]|nr:NUDIX hydrolase [Chloroflexota bacterium]MBI5713893.1 NUDIX hydrolase [Chloroflexota bacterium]